MHFSLFKGTEPDNCHLSGRQDHCAHRAFRFGVHREPLPWLLPIYPGEVEQGPWGGQTPDGAGADRHKHLSHRRPSQAESLFYLKAQLRQDLAPEHTHFPG